MRGVITAALVLLPATAAAWDGSAMWWAPAHAQNPGSGGIFGTGGEHDHRVTCNDCHVERDPAASFGVSVQFSPPVTPMGDLFAYAPGQRYQVTFQMIGEDLAVGGAGCDQYMMHTNNFAATFEDAALAPAGVLESDSGQSAAGACPTDWPYWAMGSPPPAGTTGLYRDCEVIFSRMDGDVHQHRTSWTFYWTAPTDGRAVTMNYGAVDGDCMMNSMGDAVVVDDLALVGASARGGPARRAPATLPIAAAAVLLCAAALRRRRDPR